MTSEERAARIGRYCNGLCIRKSRREGDAVVHKCREITRRPIYCAGGGVCAACGVCVCFLARFGSWLELIYDSRLIRQLFADFCPLFVERVFDFDWFGQYSANGQLFFFL